MRRHVALDVASPTDDRLGERAGSCLTPLTTMGAVEQLVMERYRGRWVGVDASGCVVSDAEELDELLDSLDAAGIVAATVQRVPTLGEPLFVGLR